jgi:YD repeat-containing protein
VYDWQGRPTTTTNQDGTTKSVSYGGCGCAGGLTATFTDEMGRGRRVISDMLGRTWKTQVLRSDGTIYSTVTNTYNVRDQITNIEEKDETTGVSQQTMMSYDGHGRLRTRKRPQEDGPTTFDYYNDDRLMHSKDARNAEGSLSYNARGLLTAATYVTPNGVAPTSSVTFQYDASGMRTVMDDGPGQVTYQYDSQNRLTGETRAFDAIAGKVFTLSYGYNLSGQLTAITYPATGAASDTINYTRDKAGRITAITGTPYGGVTSYVSGIQYRAWGAPKAASYGSGFSASAKYTARMQVSEFDIPGVIGGTYTYNDDGQLSAFVASTPQYSQYDRRMDRTFGYDEFGRMNSSVAGGYGFVATYSPQQDAFGNVTNASYHYWQNGNQPVTFSAAYQNNRVAPGSVTDAGQAQTWNYDAMGNRTSIVKTINGTPTTVESIAVDAVGRGVAGATLDGDGRTAIGQGNYYIRSTVFGGEIITTVDSSGVKTSERVLDGESLLAEQIKFSDGATSVRWHHRDPLNLVARDTEPGQVTQRVFAITPNGAQIETSEGVNLTQYYTCLYAGNNNPSCTGYNPQPASSYGYLADRANGMLAAGLKVDGALTLMSLNDVMRQVGRTGLGQPIISPALSGTPIAGGISGSFVRRSVLGWQEVAGTVTAKGGYERDYVSTVVDVWEFVPGGEGQHAGVRLSLHLVMFQNQQGGQQQLNNTKSSCVELVGRLVSESEGHRNQWKSYAMKTRDLGFDLLVSAALAFGIVEDRYTTDGFKQELVAGGQGGGVYQHIYAHAGAILIGNRLLAPPIKDGFTGNKTAWTGTQLTEYALGQDEWERDHPTADHPREMALAEIAGDHAGRLVGGLLMRHLAGNLDSKQLRAELFKTLCER